MAETAEAATEQAPAAAAARPPRLLRVEELGVVPYPAALEIQRSRAAARAAGSIPDTLLLLEHPPVFTIGRDARGSNLQVPEAALADLGIALQPCDRGGDITYHGPGQLVGYPILDLRDHRRDVRWYVGRIELALLAVLADFGLPGALDPGMRGVFIRQGKVAAIGIHVARWITTHGFALNVTTDVRPFDFIHPCGIAGARVTTLQRELGAAPDAELVRAAVVRRFCEALDVERA